VLGDDGDNELFISSSFESEVKDRLDPAHAAVFTQDRGDYGTVMAKTLPRSDGTSVVIFDVRLFLKGLPPPEAMFRHEAFHVLLHGCGESTNESRTQLSATADIHPDLVGMAGIAAEEYRVQRATYERFPDDPWGNFEALCVAAHNQIQDAAVSYAWDPFKDVGPIHTSVMQAFAALTTQAGYIAAQLDSSDQNTPAVGNDALHERMLGPAWDAVIHELRKLPPADRRVGRSELDVAVLAVAERFVEWFAQIGFRVELLGDGSTFFHVYEHEDWVMRDAIGTDPDAA
jgi:hypothetical protein